MRSYPTTAFVKQFNFKNATAFFTNAFKRKTALNKGSLFSYFVLVIVYLYHQDGMKKELDFKTIKKKSSNKNNICFAQLLARRLSNPNSKRVPPYFLLWNSRKAASYVHRLLPSIANQMKINIKKFQLDHFV